MTLWKAVEDYIIIMHWLSRIIYLYEDRGLLSASRVDFTCHTGKAATAEVRTNTWTDIH